MKNDPEPNRKRERALKRIPKIDASPELVARTIISAVDSPAPSLRKFNQRTVAARW